MGTKSPTPGILENREIGLGSECMAKGVGFAELADDLRNQEDKAPLKVSESPGWSREMPDQVGGPDLPEDLQALQWEAALSPGGTAMRQRLFPGGSEGQNSAGQRVELQAV